jgi:hypothetical protein
LTWTPRAAAAVQAATAAGGGKSGGFAWTLRGGLSRTAFRPMDSKAAVAERAARLSEADRARVRELTRDVAIRFGYDAAA